jgi:DNA-binding transcriptional LysR family regulator
MVDLAQDRFVTTKPGSWQRELTDAACKWAGFTPAIACEGDEPGALRSLIGAGLGVGFLPASSREASAEPEVAWLRVDWPSCRRTLRLLRHHDRYMSVAARQFLRFAAEYFAGQQGAGASDDPRLGAC